MADRFYQRLTIGGNPGDDYIKIMDLLIDETGLEFEEESSEGLVVGCSDAAPGDFEEAKKALREAGLSYDHFCEAKWDHEGEIWYWRPGLNPDGETECHAWSRQGGVQTVTVEDLQEFRESGQTLQEVIDMIRIPPLPEWVQPKEVS